MKLHVPLLTCLLLSQYVEAKMDFQDLLKPVEAPSSGDKKLLDMTAELGVLLAKGNTEGTTLTGKINATHQTQSWINNYQGNFLFKQNDRTVDGERESFTSAQRIFVSTQLDYKLEDPSERLFMYGEFDDDRFNNFEYQAALAIGWSEELWKDQQSEFRYSIGPGYAVSRLKDEEGQDQMGMIIRAALEYRNKLFENATFRQFFSTEADQEFSRSVSETSLAATITGSLAMKLSLNMIHNRNPNSTAKSLDTETAVTLVYQFF